MAPIAYVRYALWEHAKGDFVKSDGSPRGFSTPFTGGPVADVVIPFSDRALFEPLGTIISDSIKAKYHYNRCDENDGGSQEANIYRSFYLLETAEGYKTPSSIFPDDPFLGELNLSDRIDYMKTTLVVDFIYSAENLWLKSFTKIRDVSEQFYNIVNTFKFRNTLLYTSVSSDATLQVITRDPNTGDILTDTTVPSTSSSIGRVLIVNQNSIVVNERIFRSTMTFDMIDDRALNYLDSLIYYDVGLRLDGDFVESVFNYRSHNLIVDNVFLNEAPDPRDFGSISDAAEYSAFSQLLPNRRVSEIKTMTIQEMFVALGVPLNQYDYS